MKALLNTILDNLSDLRFRIRYAALERRAARPSRFNPAITDGEFREAMRAQMREAYDQMEDEINESVFPETGWY